MSVSRALKRLFYSTENTETSSAIDAVKKPEPPATGIRLNLGCGFDVREGWINVDMHDHHGPDLVCDVTWLKPIESNSADYVLAQDVLEHIHRVKCATALLEWNRVLKIGGQLDVRVPDVVAIVALMRDEQFASEQGHQHLLQCMFGTQSYEGDYHLNGFTELSLKHALHDAGFEIAHFGHRDEWLFDVVATKMRHAEPDNVLRIADDNTFVDAAYERYAGRAADDGGKSYFVARLAEGTPREAVIAAVKGN
ncbi:methyltransferase domain-containing protein [Mesorhizobium sp. CAU 1741]|uniref:methyltransferase domain-containing protein n=1 Tax=Mesorhizobium sp. CAU 1741 TaxID=3140366 RepID=UPI00325C0601